MFYESRMTKPQFENSWSTMAEAFESGQLRQALEQLDQGMKANSPEEFLLASDVLSAAQADRDSLNMVLKGLERFPDSGRLALIVAHHRSRQGRLLEALRVLNKLKIETLSEDERELAKGLRGCVLARMERTKSAEKIMLSIVNGGGPGSPLCAFVMAHGVMALRNFERALELFTRAHQQLPDWSSACLGRHHCLLILNRREEALQLIEESFKKKPDDPRMTQALLGHLCLTEQWQRVVDLIESILKTIEEGQADQALFMLAARAYSRLGDLDNTRRYGRKVSSEWAGKMDELDLEARRGRVKVEPIAQERNMCVAACVAIILKSWGEEVDQREIFEQMSGGQGVDDWQLDRWLRRRHIFPVDIKLSIDVVREVIDAGVPLLVTRSTEFMGHQELIVGYDDGFQELEAIDPMNGLPIHVPYERLAENYQSCGDTLVALFRATGAKFSVPARWCDQDARQRRQIGRWVYEGAIQKAQDSFAKLAADGRHTLALLLEFPGLFGDEAKHFELCQSVAERQDLDLAIRVRATMSLAQCGEEKRFRAALRAVRSRVSPFMRSYLGMLHAQACGQWPRVKRYCEVLLERAAMMPDLWFEAATAFKQCGKYQRAREALEICLEIEATHLAANTERLGQPEITLSERRRVISELRARHPRNSGLRNLDAQLDVEIGQPLEAEKKLKESIRLAPKALIPRLHLREYYLSQKRIDLANAVKLPAILKKPGETPPENQDESNATLLRTAWSEILASEESPALLDLLRRHTSSRLSLEESLELQRLRLFERRQTQRWDQSSFESCLPAALPLPRAGYLTSFLAAVVENGMSQREAHNLIIWTRTMMRGSEWTPLSRFYVARLQEAIGQQESAEFEYLKLSADGLLEALYQLGLIAFRNRNFEAARGHFQGCISLRPGYFSAWLSLAELSVAENDVALAESSLERLVLLRPYNPEIAESFLNFLGGLGQARARKRALKWIADHAHRYTAELVEAWNIELHLKNRDYQMALKTIGPALHATRGRDAFACELACFKALNRRTAMVKVLGSALEKFPEDPYFVHLKVQGLSGKPEEAFELVRRVYLSTPNEQTFSDLFKIRRSTIVATLLALYEEVEKGKEKMFLGVTSLCLRQANSELYAQWLLEMEAMQAENFEIVRLQLAFSLSTERWFNLDQRLTRYLALGGEDIQLVNLAGARLFERNPALSRKAFAIHYNTTRWPPSLCMVARCDARMGQKARALKTLWDFLQRHPSTPEVLGTLGALDEDLAKVKGPLLETLEKELPIAVRDFAITAVEAAVACQFELPERWEDWATVRARSMQRNQRQSPEGKTLKAMLGLWFKLRGHSTHFQQIYGRVRQVGRNKRERTVRRDWERNTNWIPKNEKVEKPKAKPLLKSKLVRRRHYKKRDA
jgi:tetratricopeptide (TPR) repeat protein